MWRICMMAALLGLATIAAAQAQTTPNPGMGATTPLGTPSSSDNSFSGGGIPLGATELNTPGISPLISSCSNASSNPTFDGGGTNVSSSCGTGATSSTSSGTAGTSSAASTSDQAGSGATGTATVGSNIPLGATTLGTPGESPIVTAPSGSMTPCPASSQANDNSTNSTGVSSAGGC
jgi:hypothetical protein